jgi:hypothetical protein
MTLTLTLTLPRCDTFVEPNGSVAFFERAQCSGSKAIASPHHLTPPHLTSPHLTSPHNLASPRLALALTFNSGSKALLLFGGDAATSELRTAGKQVA